jgi:hypothetical protein
MSWTHVNSTLIRESMWPMLIISTLNFPPTGIGLFSVGSKSVVNVEAEVSKLGRIGEMICGSKVGSHYCRTQPFCHFIDWSC